MKMLTQRFSRWGLDCLYPRGCVLCASDISSVEGRFYLCGSCELALPWVRGGYCKVCSRPLGGSFDGEKVCSQCKEVQPAFEAGRALFLLRDAGRAFVHTLKYSGGDYLAHDLGRLIHLVEGFRDFLRGAILVPVPLFHAKERKRGYNQSAVIARAWERESQECQIANVLCRICATPSQTGLSRVDRVVNVKNAFAIRKKALLDPASRYILVDDVFTTGSTLNACAHVLRNAGARSVGVAVLSHG